MRGGKRAGAGRPRKDVAAAQARQDAALANNSRTPTDFLLGLLNGKDVSRSMRLRAAELLLRKTNDAPVTPFVESPIHVYSVPRNCQVAGDGKITWPDGSTSDAPVLEPFAPTPDFPPERERPKVDLTPLPFEYAERVAPPNIVPMNPYARRRREQDDGLVVEPDGQPPGAA